MRWSLKIKVLEFHFSYPNRGHCNRIYTVMSDNNFINTSLFPHFNNNLYYVIISKDFLTLLFQSVNI